MGLCDETFYLFFGGTFHVMKHSTFFLGGTFHATVAIVF